MSMHMIRGIQVHGKSKPKKKPGWQKAEAEHREWLLKHGIDPDVKVKRKREFVPLTSSKSYRRETPHYPSHASSSIPDAGTKKESLKYTGDYIIGIATMHKSNLVPVGRGDNPKDYATMRRN
jgi:hypothetical protein